MIRNRPTLARKGISSARGSAVVVTANPAGQ